MGVLLVVLCRRALGHSKRKCLSVAQSVVRAPDVLQAC